MNEGDRQKSWNKKVMGFLKGIAHSILSVLDRISTRPNKTSWLWKGKMSLLSFFALHAIYLSRIFSLLQIAKFIYRYSIRPKYKEGSRRIRLTIDAKSKRPNIPPMFVELYFMIWAVLLFALPYMPWMKEVSLLTWASYYFMGESFFFLLYYFFFRRFFEERYAIMHTLEYIVLLPLIIITQARCISIICNQSLSESLSILFFPNSQTNLFIICLSVLYTALIFGIFISNLPIERVKQRGQYRYDFAIVGNGMIVQNRLKQALSKRSISSDIAILDLKRKGRAEETIGNAHFKYMEINNQSLKDISNSNILWIATPPFAHMEYLNKFINNLYIAVEKPLVTNRSELAIILQLRKSGLWNKVFCLSYYYLEKALPLTFLYAPFTFYEKYLDFHGLSRTEIMTIFGRLGQLKALTFTLFEGEDHRTWVEEKNLGGHLMETFLHLVVLARMVIGPEEEWKDKGWNITPNNGHYMSNIEYRGEAAQSGVSIHLRMGKFMPSEKIQRDGELIFEHGSIHVDLQEQHVRICVNNESETIISIKQDYTDTKYLIQLDMVERCFDENITPSIVDGSDVQIAALQWLMKEQMTNGCIR